MADFGILPILAGAGQGLEQAVQSAYNVYQQADQQARQDALRAEQEKIRTGTLTAKYADEEIRNRIAAGDAPGVQAAETMRTKGYQDMGIPTVGHKYPDLHVKPAPITPAATAPAAGEFTSLLQGMVPGYGMFDTPLGAQAQDANATAAAQQTADAQNKGNAALTLEQARKNEGIVPKTEIKAVGSDLVAITSDPITGQAVFRIVHQGDDKPTTWGNKESGGWAYEPGKGWTQFAPGIPDADTAGGEVGGKAYNNAKARYLGARLTPKAFQAWWEQNGEPVMTDPWFGDPKPQQQEVTDPNTGQKRLVIMRRPPTEGDYQQYKDFVTSEFDSTVWPTQGSGTAAAVAGPPSPIPQNVSGPQAKIGQLHPTVQSDLAAIAQMVPGIVITPRGASRSDAENQALIREGLPASPTSWHLERNGSQAADPTLTDEQGRPIPPSDSRAQAVINYLKPRYKEVKIYADGHIHFGGVKDGVAPAHPQAPAAHPQSTGQKPPPVVMGEARNLLHTAQGYSGVQGETPEPGARTEPAGRGGWQGGALDQQVGGFTDMLTKGPQEQVDTGEPTTPPTGKKPIVPARRQAPMPSAGPRQASPTPDVTSTPTPVRQPSTGTGFTGMITTTDAEERGEPITPPTEKESIKPAGPRQPDPMPDATGTPTPIAQTKPPKPTKAQAKRAKLTGKKAPTPRPRPLINPNAMSVIVP